MSTTTLSAADLELSEEQQAAVLDYVNRSHDAEEAAARSATALLRLRQGRIDFV